MKLRNKQSPDKLGEIVPYDAGKDGGIAVKTDQGIVWYYHSLAELNEEWEDYKEPKEYWFLSTGGEPHRFEGEDGIYTPRRKRIGNYFDTREEAEKAVEKLKAWKRLKDKGFRFVEGYLDNNDDFIIKAKLGHVGLIDQSDVHLLFGGEE